ncbi:fluoride efflux transporter FluC [Pediococcus claussenii]|uniref:Fluoride-specific ion channel FluC n=1 Tax=Pediococcus claussenii (strain ATCC BAA-344 / DSM 14800 / JCM 18046 / KCTC 3811 / LMG 21948 / P06) TaxID=701521 RepID=G8PD76_PEDCP|nr:CrcB family protein [Pediococcus claussenii]AEV95211.1 crcB-like family protein [Pediococcus claussenii ATCC BAA-344]ANZ70441.1 hypothetical protein AYR57_08975 [Pediococcus claussenii]ANZ72257.1 hypothetical protein AYR58_08975 [Pediococcus claussenii]KRN19606.1 hypothetical protein IV79_GL001323 [Pediococcus claussenii]
MVFLVVGVGTAIGAVIRFLFMDITKNVETIFPWSTFCINITACFIVGVLSAHLLTSLVSSFLILGVTGGLSTFSTFANESSILWKSEKRSIALLYIFGSIITGILAASIGFYL